MICCVYKRRLMAGLAEVWSAIVDDLGGGLVDGKRLVLYILNQNYNGNNS